MYSPKFDSGKFRMLMLHVADRSRDDRWFCDDKLSIILYYCDFRAFAKLQRSMTGTSYAKSPQGPAPTEMKDERQALIDDEMVEVVIERDSDGGTWHRLLPVSTSCELGEEFNDSEIEIVDDVMQTIRPLSTKEAVDLACDEYGWIMAHEQERIPYESVWLVPKRGTGIWARN